MAKTTVTADLDDNQQLNITRSDASKNHPIPLYFNMGRIGTSKYGINGFDVFCVFSTLSGKSSWLFWYLAMNRGLDTNLCDIRKLPFMTTKEKGRIPRAYAELRKNKLVIRISKGTYLINPKVILPTFSSFEKIWDKWKGACTKQGIPYE